MIILCDSNCVKLVVVLDMYSMFQGLCMPSNEAAVCIILKQRPGGNKALSLSKKRLTDNL
jgi:hypothetical protein